ncbi:hypothetical protein BH11MYX2_BH11MYX2_25490 [soil metagenome]
MFTRIQVIGRVLVATLAGCNGNKAACESTQQARSAAKGAVSRWPETPLEELAAKLETLSAAIAGNKMNELAWLDHQSKGLVALIPDMKSTTLAPEAGEKLQRDFPFHQTRLLDALADVDRVCGK